MHIKQVKYLYALLIIFIGCSEIKVYTMQQALIFRHKLGLATIQNPRKIFSGIVQSRLTNNLILIFDPMQSEKKTNDKRALVKILAQAIQAKIAPIIVTNNIVQLLCDGDSTGTSMVCASNRELHTNDWLCYGHKTQELLLLIPQNYLDQKEPKSNDQLKVEPTEEKEKIKACGFDISNFDKIDQTASLDSSTIADYIKKNIIRRSFSVQSFASIFIPYNNNRWNIYLTGHGLTPKWALSTFQHKRSINFNRINEKNLTFCDIQNDSGGGIAGLSYKNFFELLSFFNNNINVSFLHYNSCYNGGFSQTIMAERLSHIKANFIVSTQGINESSVFGEIFTLNFVKFFTNLKSFFETPLNFVKCNKEENDIQQDPITQIIKTIISQEYIDNNQPFIYTPSMRKFCPLKLDNQVKFLTNAITRAHELEGTIIDFTDPYIRTIFIYPHYISASLKINKHVAIVSPNPQTFDDIGRNRLHVIEKMEYSDSLPSVISNFISFNSSHDNVVFVIKELQCFSCSNLKLNASDDQQINIHNFILCIKTHLHDTLTEINIVFTYENQNYSISTSIDNLEDNSKELFTVLTKTSASPLTQQKLRSFTHQLLTQEVAQKLQPNDNTNAIELIIKELEAGISHKTIPTKEIGSLKRALVKHLPENSNSQKIKIPVHKPKKKNIYEALLQATQGKKR